MLQSCHGRLGEKRVEARLERLPVDVLAAPAERRAPHRCGGARRRQAPARRRRSRRLRPARRCSEERGRSRRAIAPSARSRRSPESAPMEMSSVIKAPSKPIRSRMMLTMTALESVAGAPSSTSEKTTCAVMPSGHFGASSRNGAKSCASSSASVASTRGSSLWLSTRARPWPGMCFITGSRPPLIRPSICAPPSVATESSVPARACGRRSPPCRPRSARRAPARSRR